MVKRAKNLKIKPVQVIVIDRRDEDGELWGWAIRGKSEPVNVWLSNGNDLKKLDVGGRALCRISASLPDGVISAEVIKALPAPTIQKIFGKIDGNWLVPSDKRDRRQYKVVGGIDHQDGHLVVAGISRARQSSSIEVEVIEVLGHFGSVAAIAPLTLAEGGIPTEFPDDALNEAENAKAPRLDKYRTDLRKLPLVTIDGEDAKDFDDAVFAEPDSMFSGGWLVYVAIADVSSYVSPASALDREAKKRGNSVYLPGKVVPMLPEALSNGWCSLVPDEDRASLTVRLQIDAEGHLKSYKFIRSLIRSHARLTYTDVQAWIDGDRDKIPVFLHPQVDNLVRAYSTLAAARKRRGTLDLDIPERRAILHEDQNLVKSIAERSMTEANKLIEEMMILANVATARAFSSLGTTGIFRVHDEPDRARVEALAQILKGTPAELPEKLRTLEPNDFGKILQIIKGQPYEETVKEQVLRTQSMAIYDLTNIGHFGLALQNYSHFTSPIRRYSDLMAHRALIACFELGPDGQALSDLPKAEDTAQHISETERRAQMAERRAHERYVAAYHEQDINKELIGRITGISKAGLFIRIDGSGGDAFVPVSLMGSERFDFNAASTTISSRRTGQLFALGDQCLIRLLEASPHTGSLLGELIRQITSYNLGSAKPNGDKSTRFSKKPVNSKTKSGIRNKLKRRKI